jgi:hypothetical protein
VEAGGCAAGNRAFGGSRGGTGEYDFGAGCGGVQDMMMAL